jgi:hypothetical protein
MIIRRDDGQWAKCDKLLCQWLIFIEDPFTATRVNNKRHFEQGFGGI